MAERFPTLPVLDGIRAAAIIIVFLAHAGLDRIVPGGFGVTVFFFLSGYLITSLLRVEFQQTGRINLKAFYLRRCLRILPPFYLTLLMALAVVIAGLLPATLEPRAIALQALQLSNYAIRDVAASGVPFLPIWSLAIEEHFYLLFPVCFLWMARRYTGVTQARIMAAMCLLVLALRIFHAATLEDYAEIYHWTHTRIDALLYGCILAVWSNPVLDGATRRFRPSMMHALLAVALLFLCLVIRQEFFRQTLRYSLQGMGLFVLFSYALSMQRGVIVAVLRSRIMGWVGLLSYSAYLSHYFILGMLALHAPALDPIGRGVVGAVLTLLYAQLMYWGVERPCARMRHRLHARKGTEPANSA